MQQPNILCFVTDQQRADHLGCACNPDVKTPHLDALAADGLRFLRDDRYSFAYFFGPEYGMLYDMDHDPQQQNNLFEDPAHRDARDRFLGMLDDESIRNEPWLPRKACHA